MASTELKSFIETRLLALDPSMDVSSGSPAQTKFVDPLLSYLGADPFETDIDSFLTDRFAQEFPDLYATDPGAIRDTFVNPLKLILEPWKRETNSIRRSQSVIDPTLLSDDDVDAVVANLFDTRDPGGFSIGIGRIYFQTPTDVRIELATRAFSSTGLSFFPTLPLTVSAETVAFNRDGTLFYVDVPLRAEQPGDSYNLAVGDLVGIEGVSNVVKVTNLTKFIGGSAKQDSTAFVQAAEQSLTERSLTSPRGAPALLNSVFRGSLRAVQVIGAKDPEMQRDLLVASGPGHSWITGRVELYDKLAYVRARTLEGEELDSPAAGDSVYAYLNIDGVPQSLRLVRLVVEELLFDQAAAESGFLRSYLVRWSDPSNVLGTIFGDTLSDFLSTLPRSFEGGFSKKSQIKVSSLPGGEAVDLSVPSGEVHIYGRTDIYVRPSTQDVTQAVIDGLSDLGKLGSTTKNPHFSLERLSLVTNATNAVSDSEASFSFQDAGVEVGDLIFIEEGPDAGSYVICEIAGSTVRLAQSLTASKLNVRYRILKNIRINPFEPRTVRFPFGNVEQKVLQSTIGSELVTLANTDLLQYGAKVGDTLRILSGPDAGDYTITAFDPTLGGQGAILNKKLSATSYDLAFEVFYFQEPVERPLVRVREILLLDSTQQSTGLSIPPADPVAVVPTGPMTSAKVLGGSQTASGFVLPDLAGLIDPYSNIASPGGGRYSNGYDRADGVYLPMLFGAGTYGELDTRSDTKGKTSFFVATTEVFSDAVNTPPIEPNPGECLSIKNGPNKGDYLIRAVHKFRYQVDGSTDAYVYFIQIYGEFPVDPLKLILDFCSAHAVPTGLESLSFPLQFPDFFSTWYSTLSSKLATAISNAGAAALDVSEVEAALNNMVQCRYEWGLPARGVLRSYFKEPTVFTQKTADAAQPTLFRFTTDAGEAIQYRPDPVRYSSRQVVPATTGDETDPKEFPRDLVVGGANTVAFSDDSKLPIFTAGVVVGDTLSVHEEVFLYGDKWGQAIISTEAGSSKLVAPESTGGPFTPAMVGNLLCLDAGDDAGGYRITSYVDAYTVTVDRVLSASSPVVTKSGSGASYGLSTDFGDPKFVVFSGATKPFTDSDVGAYICLFGIDYRAMGTFLIEEVLNKDITGHGDYVVLTDQSVMPAFPSGAGVTRWVIIPATDLPAPTSQLWDGVDYGGRDMVGLVPFRIYESERSDYAFSAVANDSVVSGGTTAAQVRDGVGQPYRILKDNERRITTTEMSKKVDGALYYFDTEVVSLSPSDLANIAKDSYLALEPGTFSSLGYRHAVEDTTLSYSTRETGFLDLPVVLLPLGSPDSPDAYIRLVGAPIQISYERADLVRLVQNFIDSPTDRTLAADLLARHFLPAYVSYTASYVGGRDPAVIVKAIRSYIDQLSIETPVDVSEIEKLIDQNGGNPDTPTKVAVTLYDWNRRVWVEFSEDEVGGSASSNPKVGYSGSPRLIYFIPGADASGTSSVSGEQIKLTRR